MKQKTHTLKGVIDITAVIPDWGELSAHPGLNLHKATYAVEDFFEAIEGIDDEHATLAQRIADKLPEGDVNYITIQ